MRKHLLFISLLVAGRAACQDPCAGLQVDFSFAPDPNGIAFTDGSIVNGPVTWYQWTFGDGNVSFVQDPVHSYELNGSYQVCLTIGTSIETPEGTVQCLDSTCHIVVYDEGGSGCDQYQASFTSEWTGGSTMIFFSTTDPPGGNQFWQFGDGGSGSGQQVTHTFDTTGTYTVCLVSSIWNSATEEFCNDATCLPVMVGDPMDCEGLMPSFTVTLLQGTTVLIENTTDPPASSFSWDLGDNTSASGPLVEHTYSSTGTYEICLGAGWWNEAAQDSCWNYTCQLFHLDQPEECDPSLEVGFSWSQDGATVSFIADTADGHIWDLGDGAAAFGDTIIHTFDSVAVYEVCLYAWTWNEAMQDSCWSTVCETIDLDPVFECDPEFEVSFTWAQNGEQFDLLAATNSEGAQIIWDFGDGTSGAGNETSHLYEPPGPYTVCATAWYWNASTQDTCWAMACDVIEWNAGGCDPGFAVSINAILSQNTAELTAIPTLDATGHLWDLGDGSTAIGASVTHTFEAPGPFQVCVDSWYWDEMSADTCWAEACITLDPFLSMQEIYATDRFEIFPVPANDLLIINAEADVPVPDAIVLFATDGRLVQVDRVTSWPFVMQISGVQAGIYVLRMQFPFGAVQERIVIE